MRQGGDPGAVQGSQRLDKWLWFARLVKSRTLAAGLVAEGKVKVNRVKAEKPAHAVKAGDVVTATVNRTVRVLRVLAPGARRGPAAEAALLYEDLTPRQGPGREPALDAAAGRRERGTGRPTKRDRRLLDQLKGEEY